MKAFRKFDEMNGKLTEQLRKLAKQVVHLLQLSSDLQLTPQFRNMTASDSFIY